MTKNKETALEIKTMADNLGWTCVVCGNVLTIVKDIIPHDNQSFCEADGEYYSILGLLPQTSPGSMWGTDGGGIGAVSAMRCGVFTMSKSGGNKRVLAELKKLQGEHKMYKLRKGDRCVECGNPGEPCLCPYEEDIHNRRVETVLCGDCYSQRCADI